MPLPQAIYTEPYSAAETEQYNNLRKQLGTLRTQDIETGRQALEEGAALRGRPVKSGAIATYDKLENARRQNALNALKAIDENRRNVLAEQRQGFGAQSLDALNRHRIRQGDLTDREKLFYGTLAERENAPLSRSREEDKARTDAALQILLDSVQRDRATGGGYAEGGEVEAMPMQAAIPEEPLPLDSGDYIIPVEALRFYGRKFFQDLIAKAEDAE